MLFRTIIFTAVFAAIISGLVLGMLQYISTTPIIYSAEVYEVAEETLAVPPSAAHGEAAHSHAAGVTEWEPKNETQRVGYTFFADILIAFGHSLLLTSFLALVFLKFGKPEISWRSGLIIGLGGYLSFYVATVIGLPPEVPGTVVANLELRQGWWTLTIVMTIAGLSFLYLAPPFFKVIGLVFIVLPHVFGAPQPELHGFLNQETSAIAALSQLEHQLLISTAWVNLVYWLLLGLVSGFFAGRFLKITPSAPPSLI
jgi:cobalt transporter subunit CbtA